MIVSEQRAKIDELHIAALRARLAELEAEAVVGRGAIDALSQKNYLYLRQGDTYAELTWHPRILKYRLQIIDEIYEADTWQDCLRAAGLLPQSEEDGSGK